MKHVCCDDRIKSKNVSYDCDEFKAPIISRTARFVEKILVAVGKDPGGVVVSKCVQVSKGLWYPGGIFVVSNWYLLLLSQPSNHHYSVNGHLEANDP